jgi:hypothetical protein
MDIEKVRKYCNEEIIDEEGNESDRWYLSWDGKWKF